MGAVNWTELFPTRCSALIFTAYMALFVNQGILVTSSQNSENGYAYNPVTIVLITEVFKLIISTALYCKDNSFYSLLKNSIKDVHILGLYFIPAFLYCLYNNLAFVNLAVFDPTTYYLLLQLRVVITGILFQIIFKKYLSCRQWLSLVLLTAGCMVKQLHFYEPKKHADGSKDINKNTDGFDFSINAVFILVQTVCSCLAGVYNEYLLKGRGADVNIFIQNVFMYLDSIICNIVILLVQGEFFNAFTTESLQPIFSFKVLLIVVNNGAIGIITSFFLKSLNSILKTFASALELMFTAVFSYFLFGIPIYLNTVLAIAIVSFAVFLYSQSPVVNVVSQTKLSERSEKLVPPENV